MPTPVSLENVRRKAADVGLVLEVQGDWYIVTCDGRTVLVARRFGLVRALVSRRERMYGKEEHW